ncbi:hypothetical protein SRABI27_04526 [Pedobacter sp. Bi27]|uniref:DUF4272 domain-containing protein n=1 Tax=unclassified Pedobacter TaxID=2628915 RepID=UPI001E12C4F0|nr:MULTISPECIES: DUF4272 domain-containing protein [unclassified Pedobacter]CAH0192860.1 hypothetical protein SRABI36_01796 [Pedobacter sp. Bi36]CAH0248550.1 hypothetical protein SRABI126_02890 [Pedobacter sp. Bi126]CAH0304769.1 hypothetical protein SRABI27_04526 [Pedobacter sp. Bi27]
MTAQQRKDQTEIILKENNIPINLYLPLIEEEREAVIRTAADIAKRILILAYLYTTIHNDDDKQDIIAYLKTEKLWGHVSRREQALFNKETLSEKEARNLSWRVECIKVLLWSINKIDDLGLPIDEASEIFNLIPGYMESSEEFINGAVIRDTTEILDASDLIYRIHWAVKQARIDNTEIPNINPDVVQEWHQAINWITFYEDRWDDITTDT